MGHESPHDDRLLTVQKILKLRNGPGAAILPPSLTRIHLTFAHNTTGHIGLQYASPTALPMLPWGSSYAKF